MVAVVVVAAVRIVAGVAGLAGVRVAPVMRTAIAVGMSIVGIVPRRVVVTVLSAARGDRVCDCSVLRRHGLTVLAGPVAR